MEMAGSNASVASFGSSQGTSTSSKTGRRYRTVAKKSNVDEMLFGGEQRHSAPKERTFPPVENQRPAYSSGTKNKQKTDKEPELIEVITKDMIRKLRVPRDDPSGRTLIINQNDFHRIHRASTVLTDGEREEQAEALKSEKQQRIQDCEQRKQKMQELEIQRQKNEKLSDLEQEAKEKAQYLLQKANEQMEEQEDEIKKLNETILNAKCHAIRDAQLIEKLEIKKEILEENKRLDDMMESDRVRALASKEDEENQKKTERLVGSVVLREQIKQKEDQKIMETELREQENKKRKEFLKDMQEAELEQEKLNRQKQHEIMEDVAKTKTELQAQAEKQKARQKLEEKRIEEYQKKRDKRLQAEEDEKEKQRIAKEHEIARLRAKQERVKDKKAEQDAQMAKRRQEEAEREWRKKEYEEAIKKTENEKTLCVARTDQIVCKRHNKAVEATRDRKEFERVLNEQKKEMEKDETEEMRKRHDASDYASDVRTQIKQKEMERVQGRQNFFHEGIRLDDEAKERRQKLNEIKLRKLTELQEHGVNIKYVNEVARRIEAPPPSLSNMLWVDPSVIIFQIFSLKFM